jgi:ribosomal protein S18 acetylase RimI-like enzyme
MQHKIKIQQQDHPAAEDKQYVSRQFIAYNDQQSGVFPFKEINLFAYAPDGQIIGGLFGDISWGWMHIDTLWVSESYRQNGIGTSLMDRAEAEAIAMGVHRAYLESTDFQAVDFYKKRGYQVFAQLEDQPPGHICYYLKNVNLNHQG